MKAVLKNFLKDTAERALKTFAQSFLAAACVTNGMTFADVHWAESLSVAGVATIFSIITSLASYNFGNSGTASAVDLEKK